MSRCLECKDTGWVGDIGPGIRGNHEYMPCDCMPAGADREAWLRSCVRACSDLKDPEKEINNVVECLKTAREAIKGTVGKFWEGSETQKCIDQALKPFLERENNG